MQKVGFWGKKWDISPFSDVVCNKYNFNTDMIILESRACVNCKLTPSRRLLFGSVMKLLEAAVRRLLRLYLCDKEHLDDLERSHAL